MEFKMRRVTGVDFPWPPAPGSTGYFVFTGKTLDPEDPDYEPLKPGDPVTVVPFTAGEVPPTEADLDGLDGIVRFDD